MQFRAKSYGIEAKYNCSIISILEIKESICSHWELRPSVSKWLLYWLRTLVFDISVSICFADLGS